MTFAPLPTPNFTGAGLSVRVNALATEARAARRFTTVALLMADATMAYGSGARSVVADDRHGQQGRLQLGLRRGPNRDGDASVIPPTPSESGRTHFGQ